MKMLKLGGAALLGLTTLLAGSVPAEAAHRHGPGCGHRGYGYSSRSYYGHGRDYRPYRHRSYRHRSYRHGYRAPRHYYSGRPYGYRHHGYGYYWSPPPAYYYGPRYCPPRARVGLFFGW